MKTRQEALDYGLSFPDTYLEAPFREQNWQLVRVKGSKKAFLWTYEKDGFINLNVKVDPDWRDLWRRAYDSVAPAYHQNKEHWNTIILDGSIPDEEVKKMIAIKIPCVLATGNATGRLKDGDSVIVDGTNGKVSVV
jgi:predicted DNA-binding protein (MmcQ/YjbR family)